MSSQQKNLVYALWQEVPKLVYAFWTCKPVVFSEKEYYGAGFFFADLQKIHEIYSCTLIFAVLLYVTWLVLIFYFSPTFLLPGISESLIFLSESVI